MSVELSKLQKEGLLVTKRNHFELLTGRFPLPGGAKNSGQPF